MEDFKVGDTVICNTSFQDFPQKGWKGKVIYVDPDPDYIIGVEWEKEFKWGHKCSGLGKSKHCRYYGESFIADSSTLYILNIERKQLELF